jgi:hypothetical protein
MNNRFSVFIAPLLIATALTSSPRWAMAMTIRPPNPNALEARFR